MFICDVRRRIGVLLLLVVAANWHASPSKAADLVRFSNRHDAIILPVKIGKETYDFAVVSGATFHIFDTRLRKHLIGPAESKSVEGMRVKGFQRPKMYVGNTELTAGQRVATTDLTVVRRVLGAKIFGFLGADMFRSHVVQINFDKGTVTFLRPTTRPQRIWGKPYKLKVDYGNRPTVKLAVTPKMPAVTWVVNTGASQVGSLNRTVFSRLEQSNLLRDVGGVVFVTITGVAQRREGELAQLRVGATALPPLVFASTTGQSTLGLRFLRRFNITFDIRREAIYLAPSRYVGTPDLRDRTGMYLIDKKGKAYVYGVCEDSSAAQAGIRQGDVLTAIEGTQLRLKTLSEVRRLLASPKGRLRVELLRAKDSHSVVLR